MKFFMVSKAGEGAGLLYKIWKEGNDVRIHILEPGYRTCWKDILEQVPLYNSWVDRETTIIYDSSGMGTSADFYKSKGFHVFGASVWADELENDREFGLDAMNKMGIKTPRTTYWTGREWEKAKLFVKDSKTKRLVFKPDGDLPSKLTYLPSDADDLIGYLEHVQDHYQKDIKTFALQEFIEGHIVSTEMWCDGTKFVGPPNHTVEVKKLMNDDLGPATGCSGNVVWLTDEAKVSVAKGIMKAQDECVENGFVGTIDLNTIIANGVVYGLEWTPRFGLDAMPSLLQLLDMDAGEVFSSFARGKGILKLKNKFAGGVRLSIPPYPLEPKHIKDVKTVSPNAGLPIRGLLDAHRKNIYFYEVMLNAKSELVHSEGTGAIMVASDFGDTPEECLELPYKIIEGAKIADKQYRTDLKTVLPKMYSEVKDL